MFASLLPVVTVVALGIVVPAFLTALLPARGRHSSFSSGTDRRGRVAVAASLLAAAGGTVGTAHGAGPAAAAAASLLVAAPVLVWAVLAPWWPVRAVVAWAMLVTGAVGLVAMATSRALGSAEPWSAAPVAGVGSAAVVFVLGRINGPFRRALGIRAGIRRAVRAPLFLRPALLRPALALAVFFAAMAVGGLTGVGPRPGEGSWAEAGPGTPPGSPDASGAVDGTDVRRVSAETTSQSRSAHGGGAALRTDLAHFSLAGSDSAGTRASAGLENSPAPTGYGTGTGTPTPGSASPAVDNPTGATDDAPGRTSAPVSSESAGDPNAAEVLPTDPVTETVKPVTEPVQDGGESTVEPVVAAVEEAVEPVQAVVEETAGPVQAAVEEAAEAAEQVTDPLGSALP